MTHARPPIRLTEGREDGCVELNARRLTGGTAYRAAFAIILAVIQGEHGGARKITDRPDLI